MAHNGTHLGRAPHLQMGDTKSSGLLTTAAFGDLFASNSDSSRLRHSSDGELVSLGLVNCILRRRSPRTRLETNWTRAN